MVLLLQSQAQARQAETERLFFPTLCRPASEGARPTPRGRATQPPNYCFIVARIAGVDIPRKRVRDFLTYVYGVGLTQVPQILARLVSRPRHPRPGSRDGASELLPRRILHPRGRSAPGRRACPSKRLQDIGCVAQVVAIAWACLFGPSAPRHQRPHPPGLVLAQPWRQKNKPSPMPACGAQASHIPLPQARSCKASQENRRQNKT